MNLQVTNKLILLIAVVINSTGAFAQHDHSSHGQDHQGEMMQAPHGGELKEVGKYHIEMVVDMLMKEDQITIYLFKGNMKPVSNDGITGTITFNFKDGSVISDKVRTKGDSRFVAQLKNSESFNCIVKLSIDGKTVSTVFSYSGFGNNVSSVYSCSMHPEIKSESPGKCPKCGMNLEKQ